MQIYKVSTITTKNQLFNQKLAISPFNSNFKANSDSFTRQNNGKDIAFKGELEVKFFKAVMEANKKDQLSILNNIRFDILEKDLLTGDNFMHVVCKDGTPPFLEKAIKLLRINKSKIEKILNDNNKENKTPFDYIENETFKRSIDSLVGNEFSATKPTGIVNSNVTDLASETPTSIGNQIANVETNLKVGNEVDNPIDVSGFSFESDEIIPEAVETIEQKISTLLEGKKGLDAIIGLDSAKNIINDEIVKPLLIGKNVFANGFLIHGMGRNGKTYLVDKLAEELSRDIISPSKIISLKSNASELSKLIDTSIIKIDTENPREINEISEILKENFRKTSKQGIVFMDEIKTFFDSRSTYESKLYAMQSIEKSSKNGMVLIATTNDLDVIDANLTNSLRFEKTIEVKPPKGDDISELIKNNLTFDAKMNDEEIKKLSKRMNGLSAYDITRVIENTCNKNEAPSFQNFTDEITGYAKLRNIQDITEEGTTSGYDSFLPRMVRSTNDPTSLDDVIGMTEVKTKLKKAFNPIKKEGILKDFYKENHIKKPNGILLYGPPGCGKTFIMSAIAAETKLPMYQVKASDVGSSFSNETEKNIKKIFDQLRNKYKETGEPSILFFDECDSLFGKKAKNIDQKVLNTLKEEMNNAGDDGIFVVAATNEKDDLNTAIIRDGRFDTKIEVGYPDEEARIGLISKVLNYPIFIEHKIETNIKEFARLTEGLSNASISGIFSSLSHKKGGEAAEISNSVNELNEYLKKNPIKSEEIINDIILKKEETNKMKLKQRNNSGMEWQQKTSAYDEYTERTYYGEDDPKSLEDVVGMDDTKEQMKLKVLAPLNPILRKYYKENGIPTSSGIILHGPGGVGKTFIVKAVAAESKIPLYQLNLSEQGTGIMNETAKNIKNIFNQLKKKYKETGEPSILFLDECDSVLGRVANNGSDASADRTNIVNTLKEELADAQNNGISVLAATNNYENLDPNVIRSGRFNDHIKIDYPDEKARFALISKLLAKCKLAEGLEDNKENIDSLVNLTNAASNADIKTIIDNAAILSSKEYIYKMLESFSLDNLENLEDIKSKKITFEDLEKVTIKKMDEIKEARAKEAREKARIYGGFYEGN